MSPLEGSTCIITGATSGIGKATAVELARRDARVVMVSRSRERGRAALVEVIQRSGNSAVDLLIADLSVMDEVRRLATEIADRYPQVDVLVNNAGGIFRKRRITPDGFEHTFALNHLAYFLLTNRLLDTLRASAPSRIINVASRVHSHGRIRFDDPHLEKRYSGWKAYCQSKLANILFTTELARRLDGTGICVNAMHPGSVATRFGMEDPGIFRRLMQAGRPFRRSPERAAQTIVWLAVSGEAEGLTGGYYVDEKLRTASRRARDPEAASRLWDLSAELTGV